MLNITPTKRLKLQIGKLREQLAEQSRLKEGYRRACEELKEKEAYNFALFQFNPHSTVVVDREGRVIKSNAAKQHSGIRLPNIGDVMYRDYAGKHSIDMYAELMDCLYTGKPKIFPEMQYGARVLEIAIAPFPKGALIVSRDITAEKKAETEKINLIRELQQALNEIETLRELLPMCASCKRIRDDAGYWRDVEEYFQKRHRLDFSHTLCPECVQKIYPDVWERMEHNGSSRAYG